MVHSLCIYVMEYFSIFVKPVMASKIMAKVSKPLCPLVEAINLNFTNVGSVIRTILGAKIVETTKFIVLVLR